MALNAGLAGTPPAARMTARHILPDYPAATTYVSPSGVHLEPFPVGEHRKPLLLWGEHHKPLSPWERLREGRRNP